MKSKKLTRDFYIRDTLVVAQDLLGKYLIRKTANQKIIGKIVEVEAYLGPQDKASHAYLGKKTKRNKVEYFIGGHIYIYLVYGMHWQLNIVTSLENKPECILIRGVEPTSILKANGIRNFENLTSGIKNLTNGPGKVCKYFKLDKSFYGEDLTISRRIWLEDWGNKIFKNEIQKSKRIGIDYAGKYWSKRLWRFYLKDNPFVSKSK
ncbi:MAG TPA: DNA-3-methyladenine glycosylase [Candidatus Paceibacterota bacterium]|jgi:DNA-3-methyladenine glycosylase|nr:DNA-3-methyladenine glycosylase [Candidatus Paceibacterota bacterium]